MVQVRINKYISDTGFCSRREADKLVEDARVEVNGSVALPGTKVSPGDTVRIDGEILRPNPESFVERPKLPKPKKRPMPHHPVEEEEVPAHRSHRGTRGGLRNHVDREESFKPRNDRSHQSRPKPKKDDGRSPHRH